ncbi:hypothetical protein [Pararhizobium sp. O133]|uniref:hypothetical protein n=1 Tax=Pararhizobium sp. O133 TaxID=3449278 RepID=UPI003F686FFC
MIIDHSPPQYSIRENKNGYWTVYDISTGDSLVINNVVFDSLKLTEAKLLSELLNEEHLASSDVTIH